MATMRNIMDVLKADPVKVRRLIGPNTPENKEEREKYWEEVEQSGGYDIMGSYHVYHGPIRVIKDLSQPYFQTVSQFAVEERNKDLPEDKRLCLASIVRITYEPAGAGIYLYLTLKVEDRSGNENTCRAKIFTCNRDCKELRVFDVAPYSLKHDSSTLEGFWTPVVPDKQNKEWMDTERLSKEELMQMSEKEKMRYVGLLMQKRRAKESMAEERKRIKIENAEQQQDVGYAKVYEVGKPCMHLKT